MFTTIDEVKEFTGYDVSQETVIMAQSIVEAYIGRDEVEIVSGMDKALLAKATAYQAAYMSGDEAKIFEQSATTQIMQSGNMVSFSQNGVSPWIAPLTVLTCKKLSWHRIRSVRTGGIYDAHAIKESRWSTE